MDLVSKDNTVSIKMAAKAFALVSFVLAIMKDAEINDTLRMNALEKSCINAMRGFSNITGPTAYYTFADKIGDVYSQLNEKFEMKMDRQEIPVFLEILLNLISKKNMKDFLLTNYNSGLVLDRPRLVEFIDVALYAEEKINELTKVNQRTTQEYLLSLFKSKKVKQKKPRDKKKSKAQIEHEKKVEEARASKERKLAFLATVRKKREEAVAKKGKK